MFGARLKKLRTQKGLTQKGLSTIIGVDRTTVGKYEINNVIPSPEVLNSIADYFAVSTDYLLGRTDSWQDGGLVNSIPLFETIREDLQEPTLVNCECAVQTYIMPEGLINSQKLHEPIKTYGNKGVFAIRCKDESMSGLGIGIGDIAIISTKEKVGFGDLALVVVGSEEACIKKVKRKDAILVLESANINCSPRIFIGQDMNTVQIIGKLLQVVKQF